MPPGNNFKATPPSQNRFIWILVLAAICLMGIVFGTRIYVDYKRTLNRSEERLINQTRVIDENITTNLTVVNLMLNNIFRELKVTSNKDQLNRYLEQQLVMTPGIRTLMITDNQGRCVLSNRAELLGKDFARDRDYFKVPRDAPDKGMLFLSPPYTTLLGKYVINISKPIIGNLGEFNGVVTVTLDPDYFSSLLSSTIYKPDNRVSLVHSDGTVFIAIPEAKIPVTGLNVTQSGSAFLQHISGDKPTSIRMAAGKTLGDKRIFAYHTNSPKGVRLDKQIVVAASRNLNEMLAEWRMDSGIELIIYLLFVSLSIVVTKVVLRRGIELKRLEEIRAHLAAIVEFSDDAIISKDLNGIILSWNAGAERLFTYPPEEAVGRSITMIIPPDRQDEEDQIVSRLKEGELVEHLETVRIAKDGRQIEVSVTSSPLMDNCGNIIGASKIIRDITERKKAEQALRENEVQIRVANMHLQEANEELQVQSEELQAQNEELHSQSEELLGQNNELARLWEKARQDEEALQKSHDELELRVRERTNDLQSAVDILQVEIAEREKAEANLQNSANIIEDLYNHAPCGYHSLDREGRFVRINDTELHWLGYNRDELVGKMKFTDILTSKGQKTFSENFPIFMKNGQVSNLRYDLIRKNGTVLPTLLNASAITDENGSYLASRSSVHDITELTQAENSLRSLNNLYAVLSETNQTIVRAENRNILFSEFCRIAVEHGGFLLAWVGLVREASGEVHLVAANGRTEYLDDIRITSTDEPAGEGPTGITIREGTYYICNDFQNDPCTRPWHDRGKVHGIKSSASVALKENGRVLGALTLYSGEINYFDKQHVDLLLQMGMDVSYAIENFNREARRLEAEQTLLVETTERLRTMEALREKEKMLVQQSRQAAMGEMISNIAHQWRQPLNSLGLYTQRLGFFYGTPSFNKDFLDTSVAKSMEIIQHMSKTIDDFRNYFKPDKEKGDFHVSEAIKNTLSLLEGNLQNPKIKIEIIENDSPVINGFQNEFAQVLLNILVNARDAIIEREIDDAKVTIKVCSEDGCVIVTITDNAGGIDEEIINKIFDPYFTTKGPQLGTGIGLFMSKTIIEKNMGGRLAVRNTASGAEFRIEVGPVKLNV